MSIPKRTERPISTIGVVCISYCSPLNDRCISLPDDVWQRSKTSCFSINEFIWLQVLLSLSPGKTCKTSRVSGHKFYRCCTQAEESVWQELCYSNLFSWGTSMALSAYSQQALASQLEDYWWQVDKSCSHKSCTALRHHQWSGSLCDVKQTVTAISTETSVCRALIIFPLWLLAR